MDTINNDVTKVIEDNPGYTAGVEILLKLLQNVINNPADSKYRTIKMENKTIKEKLLSVPGMKNVLLEIGFVEDDFKFQLPNTVRLAKIKKYHELFSERLRQRQQSCSSGNEKKMPTLKCTAAPTSRSFNDRTCSTRVLETYNEFLNLVEKQSDMVLQYEDPKLLKYGRSIIPILKLQENAIKTLRKIQKALKAGEDHKEPCIKDLILVELLAWFNQEFFDWVNKVPCKVCGSENGQSTIYIENGTRVEAALCCGQRTNFFRYNDIAYLLKTRRGRCGEYANCFTFLCRCMGYDARCVHATFDHVWTEVYSISQKRWLHVDPSDNIIDAPKIYQHGWKRKVDYIIAVSKDDIQDVTWRYTSNHNETLQSRNKCSEAELLNSINNIRIKRHLMLSEARKSYLSKRALLELAELMIERQPTEQEKLGRSSGDIFWRMERGEQSNTNCFVFELNKKEIDNKQFNLRYSCADNLYERYILGDGSIQVLETYKSWDACIFESKNIFRKVEKDWKMVYLARLEGADTADIRWKFNFKNSGLKVKTYTLKFEKKTYENGIIDFKILPDDSLNIVGSTGFAIQVNLSAGIGSIAWQHTQLFRQSINSNDYPFELKIEFL